ncbi:MAG: TonB-dependent receptor plug domain-containing protein, partial [Holophaga sp.]|nr:TonB-dependent receptor plug domain-containing protein [Holophaga sp.]
MRKNCFFTGTSTALVCAFPMLGQEAKTMEDELLALLNTPVTVASQKAMTTRESPGIISLVTREEILTSGARDLLDVLRLVPGFDFASDIQGVVGPAVRGLWGFEGKVLLLVDGQELNETRYGTVQFGNHVPVDQIRQIEIIRGPGSAIYGGFAELAVINVVTRSGSDLNGVSGS